VAGLPEKLRTGVFPDTSNPSTGFAGPPPLQGGLSRASHHLFLGVS